MAPTPSELRQDKLCALEFAANDLQQGNVKGFQLWWDYAKCCLLGAERMATPEKPADIIIFIRFMPDKEMAYLRHRAWTIQTSAHTLLLAHIPVYPWNMQKFITFST